MPYPATWRLIPAHAGSTLRIRIGQSWRWAHPRSRGEHRICFFRKCRSRGSSPLTRGALPFLAGVAYCWGLIPAHAGSTWLMTSSMWASSAHPRSRGEHVLVSALGNPWRGSSPLTRGARVSPILMNETVGLIPAHAGSTILSPSHTGIRSAHPRSRGEHMQPTKNLRTKSGSSPLTRGALRKFAA